MSWLTKRIPTVLGLLLLAAILGGWWYWQSQNKPKIDQAIVPQEVRITNVQDNKFSISWTTKSKTQGAIEYGEVGQKMTNTAVDERGSEERLTHQVTVAGIQPSTAYAIRILSGPEKLKFDNNGSPYTVTTGPVIGTTPPSRNLYGQIELPTGQLPDEAIVYLALPGASVASAVTTNGGNYTFTLSTIRTSDLKSYVAVDPAATIASVTIVDGKTATVATVSLANAEPVPKITLGKNVDFRTNPQAETPEVAQVEEPVKPEIFNVEPLKTSNDVNLVTTPTVVILNPGSEGEKINSLRPEFRGTGPKSTTLSLTITGQKSVSDTVQVGSDGTWSYAPQSDLKTGSQILTLSYLNSAKIEQRVSRGFVIGTGTAGDPAFVATPSASRKASATPVASTKASPTPSSRAAMPATESGVPVTGVVENTWMGIGLGVLLIITGLIFI